MARMVGKRPWYDTKVVQVPPSLQVVVPDAVVSAEVFGTTVLAPVVTVVPDAVTSSEAEGSPTVVPVVTVIPDGIATGEAEGTPTLVPVVTVTPTGVASTESFGTVLLVPTVTITPTGIASVEAEGSPVLAPIAVVLPTGIASGEVEGSPTLVPGAVVVIPDGIASAEVFGTPAASFRRIVRPLSILPGFAGIPTIVVEGVTAPFGLSPLKRLGIGRVVHLLENSSYLAALDRIDGWEAVEEVPGGYQSASGRVPYSVVQNRFDDGDLLSSYLEEDGTDLFGGRILGTPADSGGITSLTAEGWAHLLETNVQTILAEATDYSLWSPMSGDPSNYNQGFLSKNEGVFSVTNENMLEWSYPKGADLHENDNAGQVFWTQGGNVSSLSFHMAAPGGDRPYLELMVYLRNGPVDHVEIGAPDIRLPIDAQWTGSNADGVFADIDLDLTPYGPGDQVILVLRVTGAITTSGPPDAAYWLRLTNLRVRGLATSDNMSAQDLFLAVFAAAGIRLDELDPVLDNILPLYVQSSALSNPLLQANLLSDTYYSILGGRIPKGRAGWWTSHRFAITDREAPFEPAWSPRYGTVFVQFQYANTDATGFVSATAKAPDVSPRSISFSALNPLPSPDSALAMAQIAANFLNSHRLGGSGSAATVLDANGVRRSAHILRGGATLEHINAPVPMRLMQVRRTASKVDWMCDPGLEVLNRLFAQFAQSQAKLGASDSFAGVSV